MKKIMFFLICLLINTGVNAEEIKVHFSKCVDGDTAKFIYNNEEITARFLAIDTPETVHPNIEEEPFGKEASEYTCNSLKSATEIILEFDENSDKRDKYDRYLVWVFVDGKLLQKELIKKGYAQVAYLYGDYKYTKELQVEEKNAQKKAIGIWDINNIDLGEAINNGTSTEESMTTIYHQEYNLPLIISAFIIIVLICTISEEGKKKLLRILKKSFKKNLKK